MRVLRVYHAGRNHAHRARERALVVAGVEVTLVVPREWPEGGGEHVLTPESFRVIELDVKRPGDVNRHRYADTASLRRILADVRPDVLDVHEEPFSLAVRQWLSIAPPGLPVVTYTAQNVDKRFPPPFARYERAAHRRIAGIYPCSRQAGSVARGKGFTGLIEVLPLGYDDALFTPGTQSADDDELVFALAGRLVPEKGVVDAVEVVARVHAQRPARLVIVGDGPEAGRARQRAASLGIAERVEIVPWQPASELAQTYRQAHFVLAPSCPTETWVEQFGRFIVEAHASGAVPAGYASGSIPEVAEGAVVLADVGRPDLLADRVLEVAAGPGGYESLRQAGIQLGLSRTWTEIGRREAAFYARIASGNVDPVILPLSPARRRAAARAELGPTAATTAGERPFAVPVLRKGGLGAAALAWLIDVGGETTARLAPRQRRIDS